MPREGHDSGGHKCRQQRNNFNPRAPRGARPACVVAITGDSAISIHVPREGHDSPAIASSRDDAPFQSTCPARGTTTVFSTRSTDAAFQSTCPARGTTTRFYRKNVGFVISIHVPREGHDWASAVVVDCWCSISIHVPREGHDKTEIELLELGQHFNPRAPRGARLVEQCLRDGDSRYFNPRAPRGARHIGSCKSK